MKKLLEKLKSLRKRVERGEAKTKRVLIAGKIHIVDEEGNFVSNLKEKWDINVAN
jgi:hypothetical protein